MNDRDRALIEAAADAALKRAFYEARPLLLQCLVSGNYFKVEAVFHGKDHALNTARVTASPTIDCLTQ